MFHPAYFEYALIAAAVVALPARDLLHLVRRRKLHATRTIPVRSREENRIFDLVEPAKPKEKEKPKPKEEVPITDSTEAEPPSMEPPPDRSRFLWSGEDFRLETQQANITLGPAWLVFKQLRPIPISPTISPTTTFRLNFPIPDNSHFAQQVKPNIAYSNNTDLPSRPIGLVLSYSESGFPRVADPARTGLPRNVFPYYPVGLLGGNSTASAAAGITFIIPRPNIGLIVPGPSRVISVYFLYDGVSTTTIGRTSQLWIFFTLTGVSGLPQGVI
jgi:hypothetical protein